MTVLSSSLKDYLIGIALIAALLLPWFLVQLHMRVPADAAWLAGAAELFMAGQKMSEAYFDTNPPMSYMIFVPAVLLTKLGMPLWYGITVYGFALVALCFALFARMLWAWKELDVSLKFAVLAAYAAGITLFSHYEFAQKDHLIAAALVPFLFAQLSRNLNISLPRWCEWSALVVGTFFILLKPHYGLLAVLMMAQRVYQVRNIKALFAPDFWVLAAGVILYGLAIAVWFPDFVSEVLPYSLELYVSVPNPNIWGVALGLGLMGGCALTAAAFTSDNKEVKAAGIFFSAMAVAAIIPFVVQMKGFSLHMLPALTLLFMAVSFAVVMIARCKLPHHRLFPFAVVLAVLGLGYLISPPNPAYATHDSFRENSLVKYLEEQDPENGFLMQSYRTNIIAPASLYSGYKFASRFSCIWFLPFPEDEARQGELKEIFGDYLADDLERFKPGLVALYAEPSDDISVLKTFGGSEGFDKAWSHYRFKETFFLDYGESYASTRHASHNNMKVLYNVYERVGD